MTRIKVTQLVWDGNNQEHIKKHNVFIDQVEEIGRNQLVHKKGHSGRYIIIGRSGTRILSVVLKRVKTGIYYVVTARDADKKERKLIYEKEKQNSQI